MSTTEASDALVQILGGTVESDGRWVGNAACRLLLDPDEAANPSYTQITRGRVARHLERLVEDDAIRVTPGPRAEGYPYRDLEVIWMESGGPHDPRIAIQQRYFDLIEEHCRPEKWSAIPIRPRGAKGLGPHLCTVILCAQRSDQGIVGLVAPVACDGSRATVLCGTKPEPEHAHAVAEGEHG